MTAIVLDTETTGTDKGVDRVIEIAIAWWQTDREFTQRFNPGRPIPEEASKVHGILDEHVADKPPFQLYAGSIAEWIGEADAVLGADIFFDQEILDWEFRRLDIKVRWPTLVCTRRIWNAYEPPESRNLQNAYKRFVDPAGFEGHHSALSDVRACVAVLKKQIEMFGLDGKSWSEFDPKTERQWGPTAHVLLDDRDLLVANFGKHRGKMISDIDVGYWKWLTNQDFPYHVVLLAHEAIRAQGDAGAIREWARKYAKENFR